MCAISLLKTCQEYLGQCWIFLVVWAHSTEGASSPALVNCHSRKSGTDSGISSFVLSKLWNISQSLFNGKLLFLCQHQSLWNSQPLLLLISISLSSLRSLWLHIRSLSKSNRVNIPMGSCWFYTHWRSIQISLPAVSFFVSLLHFYLCWPVSTSDYPFLKYVLSFITGRQEVSTTPCFALCARTDTRCAVSLRQRALKETAWLVTDQGEHLWYV